ncbi:MAG TPA: IPT/TIG domain-containing protein [Kofleriaceae bacterium]|nr:IPT/TIG domain-containing protein [Kofleriaceae bacterium]
MTSWLIALGVAAGLGASATTSLAQIVRDHRNPPPPPPIERDHRTPPIAGPTEAPPPLREERQAARAGFVWIAGRWDWRGKWEWIDGHWERERAGKRWNPGHWDRQGDHWSFFEGGWIEGGAAMPPPPLPGPPPPMNDGRPHAAPPPLREERIAARAGFVFVRGRWDWRNGNWAWIDGHWERERAGKQWREARWEQRDGAFVLIDGDWIIAGAVPPPPPAGGTLSSIEHHHEWTIDRPMISSYWPPRGRIGSRIVIHGRNFPDDTAVLWNGSQINGARVGPDEIVVAVPPRATSGMLSLRAGRRELFVGNYEVADYDAALEARRLADAARLKAEQDWADRQRSLAKDRAARQAAFDQQVQDEINTREQRRQDRLRELRAKWEAAFLADPDTQSELALHAQRVADLQRMKEVAELSENGKLVVRIGVASSREDQRHEDRMTALHGAFGRKP